MGIVLSLIKGEGCDCISEKQEIREIDPKVLIPNAKRIEIETMGDYLRVSKIEAVKELYVWWESRIRLWKWLWDYK